MAKLATLAAILGVLLVLSHAVAANRATITTVDIEETENQRSRGGGCYEQLNNCEQLFEEVMRYGGGQYGGQGSGRWGGQGSGGQGQCSSQQMRQSRNFRPCCQELRQTDERCRCEGLREVIREKMGGMGGQGSQQEERRCVRNLQNMCGVGQSCNYMSMEY